jgi:AcrR family transcriptional regulator
MAPRAYNNETRQLQQAGLKARIAAAAAELHAERGVLASSYADIAERAGVSLPTVYKHFPSQPELIAACTGHVAGQAPHLQADRILAAATLPDAAAALVEGMDRIHAHFEPWASWREQRHVPALADFYAGNRQRSLGLIKAVLERHLPAGDHGETAAAWETLLHFDPWQRLVRDHKLSRAAVRRILIQLLLAVCGPHPAAVPNPSPTRKK